MFSLGNYYHPRTHIHSNLMMTSLKLQIHVCIYIYKSASKSQYEFSYINIMSLDSVIPKRAFVIITSRFPLRLHMMSFYMIPLKLQKEIISGSNCILICYHHLIYAANTIFFPHNKYIILKSCACRIQAIFPLQH